LEITEEVAGIKYFRKLLTEIEKRIWNNHQVLTDRQNFQLAITNAYTACTNATMWLGMSLGEIRREMEENTKSQPLLSKEEAAAEEEEIMKGLGLPIAPPAMGTETPAVLGDQPVASTESPATGTSAAAPVKPSRKNAKKEAAPEINDTPAK